MLRFAHLFDAIDRTTSTNAKVAAMRALLRQRAAADAAWAVFFLTGRRLKRLVPSAAIRDWTLAATGLPDWLLGECYSVVGDGAETAALVLDQLPIGTHRGPVARAVAGRADPAAAPARPRGAAGARHRRGFASSIGAALHPAQAAHRRAPGRRVADAGRPRAGGGGVAADHRGRGAADGRLDADGRVVRALLSAEQSSDDRSRPYPFFLAAPLGGRSRQRLAIATTG